jgi:hypothetical protein
VSTAKKKHQEHKGSVSTSTFITVSVLVSIVVLLLSAFATQKLIGDIRFNNRVIVKKSAANRQLKENLEAIPQLKANYDSLGPRVQLIMDSLPKTPDYPAAVSMLEVMAGTSGVRLKSVSPEGSAGATDVASGQSGQPASGPASHVVTASVEGTYDNLLRFYANLEIGSRPLKVTAITQDGATGSQEAQVEFSSYYQGPVNLTPKTEVVK